MNSILILAAGTSYYAGLTAKYWLEDVAKIQTSVEISSEYRYRKTVPNKNQLVISISQSGETLDTIEALKHASKMGHKKTLAICNVQESAIARASKLTFYTRAGIEIGVASTKAFTTQLVSLFILTITLAKNKKLITRKLETKYLNDLRGLVGGIQTALNLEPQIKQWAKHFSNKEHALFLGRGVHYPIALEGSLKLKEISSTKETLITVSLFTDWFFFVMNESATGRLLYTSVCLILPLRKYLICKFKLFTTFPIIFRDFKISISLSVLFAEAPPIIPKSSKAANSVEIPDLLLSLIKIDADAVYSGVAYLKYKKADAKVIRIHSKNHFQCDTYFSNSSLMFKLSLSALSIAL